jgi:hypothetical protein
MGDEKNKSLQFGKTPWDGLSHEDLLRETQRMASALIRARSVLQQVCQGREESPYWRPDGLGGDALARIDQALVRYDEAGDWGCYRAFFRYADSLLFAAGPMNDPWWICDRCKGMQSPCGPDQAGASTCYRAGCEGQVLRPITWQDLAPGHDEEG